MTQQNLRFTKKPVTIEAFQMTEARRLDNSEWPEWLNAAWNKNEGEEGSVFRQNMDATLPDLLCIWTPEGVHLVNWGDWIIRGVKGELYPCKPDIFEATYTPEALSLPATEQASATTAREIAAQCWCDAETSGIEMDHRLAEAFAKRLEPLLSKSAEPSIQDAMRIVSKALLSDPDYAWSWHCNIAMAAYDEGVSHYAANAAAARFLAMLVPCLNTTKHAGFPEKSQASAEAVEPVAWQGLHDHTDLYYRKPAPAPLPELSEADVLERCAKWCDEQPRSFSYGRQASDMVRRFAADIAAKKGNAA